MLFSFALIICVAACNGGKKATLTRQGMELRSEINREKIVSALELDRNVISSGPDHFLEVTFTIKNTTDQPIRVIFSSTQQYDFFIEDESGRQYWRWSNGRFFAMMILEKELGKEPWVHIEDIPTVDRHGKPLPAGRYILRARLVGDKSIDNQIPFRIEGPCL